MKKPISSPAQGTPFDITINRLYEKAQSKGKLPPPMPKAFETTIVNIKRLKPNG